MAHEDREWLVRARKVISGASNTLNDREQKLLRLRFEELRPQEEVAAELGVTVRSMQRYQAQVLTKLFKALRTAGLDQTSD